MTTEQAIIASINRLQQNLQDTKVYSVVIEPTTNKIKTLYELLNTTISSNDEIAEVVPQGISFQQMCNYNVATQDFRNAYDEEYLIDLDTSKSLELCLCFITKTMLPQTNKTYDEKGKPKFVVMANPKGTLSRAEFFDGIAAIKNKANSIVNRKLSLDKKIFESDYFNEGYNLFCRSDSSILYQKLTRVECIQSITWLELVLYLALEYEPIAYSLGLQDKEKYNFSENLQKDIAKANELGVTLDFKLDADGYISFDVLQQPVAEYMKNIIQNNVAVPYLIWFSYLRLLELGIINISAKQLLGFVTREDFSSVLFNITNHTIEYDYERSLE